MADVAIETTINVYSMIEIDKIRDGVKLVPSKRGSGSNTVANGL
jgi:hypothetical protein